MDSVKCILTVGEAFDHAIETKRLHGKTSSVRKLEFCKAKANAYADIHDLPLESIRKEWVDSFALWLTEDQGLTENTRATYLRAMFSAFRLAGKTGAKADLSAFSTELRANSEPVTKGNREVASIDPERDLWFAMKCRAVDSGQMVGLIRRDFPQVETFRTDVEQYVLTRSGKQRQMVELLKDIVFFCTTLKVCEKMKYTYRTVAYIYDYASGDGRQMAVVSRSDMKMFMYINEMAPERILYYFPDEADCPRIANGVKVEVREGKFKGAEGVVTGNSRDNELDAMVAVEFPRLGIVATAPIPWRFLIEKTNG